MTNEIIKHYFYEKKQNYKMKQQIIDYQLMTYQFVLGVNSFLNLILVQYLNVAPNKVLNNV